jgi:hypothetical protein
MHRIRLIHFNASEAQKRIEQLQNSGYSVDCEMLDPRTILNKLKADPPSAIVVDLTKQPSLGRDLALILRKYKNTRYVPLVLVEGDQEKVARIQEVLPDAIYATWKNIRNSLKKAILNPLKEPVVPKSIFDTYKDRPLQKKLGIKENSIVALIDPPSDFKKTLGELPEDVKLHSQAHRESNLVLWFVRTRNDLKEQVRTISELLSEKAGLWIAWPKKSSGVISDLSQSDVRKEGLDAGLVDYKICSIDRTWSGLLFTRLKKR